ncbi:DNA repair protein rad52 [Lecanora helva]
MPGDGEDEFGSDDFDEADFSVPHGDHPDEVCLAPVNASDRLRRRSSLPHKPHQPPVRDAKQNCLQRPRLPPLDDNSTGSRAAPQTPINSSRSNLGPVIYANGQFANQDPLPRPPDSAMPNQQANSSGQAQQDSFPQFPQYAQQSSGGPQHDNQCNDSSNLINHDAPVGFFTARAAESLQGGSGLPIKAPSFNPHLESPSIRKTPGVDHTKTKPVGRDVVGNSASAQPPSTNVPRANFVNPQTDKTRRLGMPGGSPSPLQNRGSYKPPSMKRPAESNLVRSALGDVTAASVNEAVADAGDEKRPRISMEAQGTGNGGALNV